MRSKGFHRLKDILSKRPAGIESAYNNVRRPARVAPDFNLWRTSATSAAFPPKPGVGEHHSNCQTAQHGTVDEPSMSRQESAASR
ncbi:hypothetical protein EVAR_32507_1 [Eumeta japonica]|uniref:Uncharacterized protein n=1 Tax=Eumeta variegata TaxID=151549 RepID=A0A4C1W6K0_EUMVA|nr:hypothetical protein EVAR_32507_1 [Eumeta japonica]